MFAVERGGRRIAVQLAIALPDIVRVRPDPSEIVAVEPAVEDGDDVDMSW